MFRDHRHLDRFIHPAAKQKETNESEKIMKKRFWGPEHQVNNHNNGWGAYCTNTGAPGPYVSLTGTENGACQQLSLLRRGRWTCQAQAACCNLLTRRDLPSPLCNSLKRTPSHLAQDSPLHTQLCNVSLFDDMHILVLRKL